MSDGFSEALDSTDTHRITVDKMPNGSIPLTVSGGARKLFPEHRHNKQAHYTYHLPHQSYAHRLLTGSKLGLRLCARRSRAWSRRTGADALLMQFY